MDRHSSLIMGVLNITPDSFSGDGIMKTTDVVAVACDQALRMIEAGADILDIGGESSRPGAVAVDWEEEIRRTLPVIKAIRQQTSHPISIDTVKAKVAEAALAEGATIINDISALQDPAMAAVAQKANAKIILMDNRSDPEAVRHDTTIGGEYSASETSDIIQNVKHNLSVRARFAEQSGIDRQNIILDPGLGFGKTVEQNLCLIREVSSLKALGYPVLLGPSRKSFIGRVLDLPVDERLEGTAALVALAAFWGADILRVHDVKFMSRVVQMAERVRNLPGNTS